MEVGDSRVLAGAKIHGFLTASDLDVGKLMDDASTRWFRPNEVHAILSNYSLFKIQPQPIDNPTSGRVLLFDRKMLRNFRKDGHNWKKKKDGKTVQEAHEKLKIGNEERIHVYYARSEDDPNFYRRCYWLLDKDLERIVLVHYRQTSEDNSFEQSPTTVERTEALPLRGIQDGSPLTPPNSASGSAQSVVSEPAVICDENHEINSREYYANYDDSARSMLDTCSKLQNYELKLHEINTLDWDELVGSTSNNLAPISRLPSNIISGNDICGIDPFNGQDVALVSSRIGQVAGFDLDVVCNGNTNTNMDDALPSQNTFGNWNCINYDSHSLPNDPKLQGQSFTIAETAPAGEALGNHIFNITEFSPCWSYCTEETKLLVVGNFCESKKHLMLSNIYCVFGDICTKAEMVHPGVYRCMVLPQSPGLVNLYLTMDGRTPISQVLNFDCRDLPNGTEHELLASSEDGSNKLKWDNYQFQKRLAYLLFGTSNNISILSSRVPTRSLNEAKQFALKTFPLIEKDWLNFLRLDSAHDVSSLLLREQFIELLLKNKFQEWLLLKVAEGCKATGRDSQGQGVMHLCAILDYTWAIRPYTLSGLSLDFRDIHGWTALHWAAYYGREKMVAALLSAGANPSLVTDPNKESHGGSTAADLASMQGYDGLAAYLAEKGLTAHFEAMALSGNIIARGEPISDTRVKCEPENLSEQELCLKESLAAYRNAADAADRIQSALRERALKLQTKAVQLVKPEMEAAQIVAALKIQHAFRKYNRRRLMKAAARIQSHFRTWKTRRQFIDMRKKAVKIQAIFRGHQVRMQYRRIIWSVGVLEKAILRWRLKRKGLRGIQVETTESMIVDTTPESTGEEEFYRISRMQAEERVQRSVVRVQAMFRSYRAQQEYRRMKMAYEEAKVEFGELDQYQ